MKKRFLLLSFLSSVVLAGDCPDEIVANAPVGPSTCLGDYQVTVSALYWTAYQAGLETAVNNGVMVPIINPTPSEIGEINNLDGAKYVPSRSRWDLGLQFGVGYRSPCDGWDFDFLWSHIHPSATVKEEAVYSDQTLVALWSAFAPAQGSVTYGRYIESHWKLCLDLVDLDLGREFWTSTRLSMRPHIGFRYGRVKQDYDLEQLGGSWSPRVGPNQEPFNSDVHLDNRFGGFGLRSGLDSRWQFGCGWSLYGSGSGSILYGRFHIKQDEEIRLGIAPHTKTKILEIEDTFRASRGILDMKVGIEYAQLFGMGVYAVSARLLWEHHVFFHQNQLWRITRLAKSQGPVNNLSGENSFAQSRGTLSTKGFTLSVAVQF